MPQQQPLDQILHRPLAHLLVARFTALLPHILDILGTQRFDLGLNLLLRDFNPVNLHRHIAIPISAEPRTPPSPCQTLRQVRSVSHTPRARVNAGFGHAGFGRGEVIPPLTAAGHHSILYA